MTGRRRRPAKCPPAPPDRRKTLAAAPVDAGGTPSLAGPPRGGQAEGQFEEGKARVLTACWRTPMFRRPMFYLVPAGAMCLIAASCGSPNRPEGSAGGAAAAAVPPAPSGGPTAPAATRPTPTTSPHPLGGQWGQDWRVPAVMQRGGVRGHPPPPP